MIAAVVVVLALLKEVNIMRKKFVRCLLVAGVLAVLIGAPMAPAAFAEDCQHNSQTSC